MQIEFFIKNKNNPGIIVPAILNEHNTCFDLKLYKEYNADEHKINSKIFRPQKVITKTLDSSILDINGEKITHTVLVDVARISLAIQKLIVSRKTAFTTGGNVTLKSKPSNDQEAEIAELVNETWRKNKLQYRNADIFRALASETEVAEIWYSKVNLDKTISLKTKIYTPSDGYELVPIFDAHKDLIAFGLQYATTLNNEVINHLDIYDELEIVRYTQRSGYTWVIEEVIQHNYGKIPVIYYSIKQSVWHDVQNMIERLEVLMSNFADTNDYNGSPILFSNGMIEGWSDKGEQGKLIEGKGEGAKLEYVSWDSAPESIKLEIEKLTEFIYTITQTPNISFSEMKGLGDVSGVAFDRIMIDAHLNATDHHNGSYGEGIQRRINFLLSALGNIYPNLKIASEIEITPIFSLFSIDDESDRIDNAMKANGGLPVTSHLDSIKQAGLSDDAEFTLQQINNQQPVTATNKNI